MSSYTPANRVAEIEAEYAALLARREEERPAVDRKAAEVAARASERFERRRQTRFIERMETRRRARQSSNTNTDQEVT